IFKGKVVQRIWFTGDDILDCQIVTFSQGWTAKCIRLHWQKEIFLPETVYQNLSWRHTHVISLLGIDGYGNHVTIEFTWECEQNNIELLFLHAHSSNVLRCLGLGTFSTLRL
ncbi:hypothetical protein C7212DRAFT_212617, partial [Tuber magnatum]